MDKKIIDMKVSKTSNCKKVGASIAKFFKDGCNEVSITYIGAGASLQTMKAIACASGFLAPQGKRLFCLVGFMDKEVPVENSEEKTKVTIMNVRVMCE